MVQNKGLILKERVDEWPEAGKHLVVESRDFDIDQAPPKGGLTLKNYYVSFDPYQRGRMRRPEVESYSAPFPTGKPIPNRGIAKVIKSDDSRFKPGDVVVCPAARTEEYSAVEAELAKGCRVLENPHGLDVRDFIGALGMPGLTAWSSFYDIGKPKKGEVLFVSAASGAVGQLVGQLGKHEGLTVVGSVGDDKKLDYIVKELGFDGGFNYKKEKPADALARLCPKGLDIYYDNVGGEQLEAAIDKMNQWGRIVACGAVSQYNLAPDKRYGVKNTARVVGARITWRGFIVTDENMGPRYAEDHQEKLQKWIADGSFKTKLSVTKGIDNAAEGFIGMLRGENFGKSILEIADLDADK